MKAIGKGIMVVLVTICLWGFMAPKARAGTTGELAKLINEHVNVVIHQGTCKVDAQGMLTTTVEEAKEMVRCEAGIGDDPSIHYVLLYDNKGPATLIRFEVNTKAQTILWRSGTEV